MTPLMTDNSVNLYPADCFKSYIDQLPKTIGDYEDDFPRFASQLLIWYLDAELPFYDIKVHRFLETEGNAVR